MKTVFILLICGIFSISFGQSDFDFSYDYAEFKYDSTDNYIEIYYSFYPQIFSLTKTDTALNIKGLLNLSIKNISNDSLLIDNNWEIKAHFSDTSEYLNKNAMLGVIGIKAPEGEYNFEINLRDMNNEVNKKSYSEKLIISRKRYSTLSISDIQLASRILNENVNTNSIFYKNTLEVFPNPSAIYTQHNPVLYYYCELYNLNSVNDSIYLQRRLLNSNGIKVYEKTRIIFNNQQSIVDVGFINLNEYPTDSYSLEFTLKDKSGAGSSVSKKKYFLVNPNIKKDFLINSTKDYMSSEFGVLSNEECDDMFNKSKIIASSDELDQYEVLDSLDSKREFLFDFWRKRDDVPQTSINEFKVNYFSRIHIASERYRTVTNPGYETDRGRVYARFGEPDEIDRHPNETDSKPYEIWYYHQIEGGVYFVFGDYTGFNNYELLHSTLRGEINDPQWMRRLFTN
jgi:GWxTD domain-containing protein